MIRSRIGWVTRWRAEAAAKAEATPLVELRCKWCGSRPVVSRRSRLCEACANQPIELAE
jgi:hypothetical protein